MTRGRIDTDEGKRLRGGAGRDVGQSTRGRRRRGAQRGPARPHHGQGRPTARTCSISDGRPVRRHALPLPEPPARMPAGPKKCWQLPRLQIDESRSFGREIQGSMFADRGKGCAHVDAIGSMRHTALVACRADPSTHTCRWHTMAAVRRTASWCLPMCSSQSCPCFGKRCIHAVAGQPRN